MYLSDGIARLEGWRVEGSRVRLLNNPGAIICSHADIAQCDESGFAHFDSAALGWQALQQEVDYKIKTQRTIRRIASRWARAELYSLKLSQITGYGQDMVLP
jgi:hypothetical protein